METPLPVSNNPREGKQGRRLYYRLKTSIHKSGLTIAQLQPALESSGTDLEDDLAAVLVKHSKKARGIVTPIRAEDCGIMPNGYSVYVKGGVRKDKLEGDTEFGNVDYVCPLNDQDGDYIGGATMLERAHKLGAIGSLGYAAELLKAQKAGKEIFPVESRGKHYFIMAMTELLVDDRDHVVGYFRWRGGLQEWVLSFNLVDSYYYRRGRLLVPREKKSLAA